MSRLPTETAGTFVTAREGFTVYGLRTEQLEVSVIPELGANLISLRSVRSGREWMWQRPDAPVLFTNACGDAFERSPLAGAVECLPTIAACTLEGRALPDHGEAWAVPWQLDEPAFRDGVIHTCAQLPVSGLHVTRRLYLDGPVVHLEYRAVNLSPERAVPCLWAFHPLLSVDPDDCLELPESVRTLHAASSKGFPELAGKHTWDWPESSPGLRLDRVGSGWPAGSYAKLFAEFPAGSVARAALLRGAERLEFRFDPAQLPYLGIWCTHRGWHGFTHLALEPASDRCDSVADAQSQPLAPLGARQWCFEMEWSSVE